MNQSLALAVCAASLSLSTIAFATPPKDGVAIAPSDAARTGRTRELERVRGGVPISVWLSILSKETVQASEREPITTLVREYLAVTKAWETNGKKKFDDLAALVRAARTAGEAPTADVLASIREVRAARPQMLNLQDRVWRRLTKREQMLFIRSIDAFKEQREAEKAKARVRQVGNDGDKKSGGPAIATPTPSTPKVPTSTAPWSFVTPADSTKTAKQK